MAAEKLNGTFFALRRRDRTVLFPATLVLIGILALIIAAFVGLNWRAFAVFGQLFQTAGAPSTEDGTEAVLAIFSLFGTALLFMFPAYMAVASYEAACLRWMIRGEVPGIFGLTLNADMWRVYSVYWCWFGLQMVVSTVVSTLIMPIMFMNMGSVMTNPNAGGEAFLQTQLTLQLVVMVLQYVPLIFLGVRFGPAAAASIARKKFSFAEAWTVTKRRFWELFGSFALLWVIYGVVMVLLLGLILTPIFGALWSGGVNASPEDVSRAFASVFTAQNLAIIGALYLLLALLGLVYAVLSYGINARAVIAAVDEGKIDGHTPNVSRVFE